MDAANGRRMHASSLNAVKEYLVQTRRLFVANYDNSFGEMHVLVLFKDQWVDCTIIYAQPAFCKVVNK